MATKTRYQVVSTGREGSEFREKRRFRFWNRATNWARRQVERNRTARIKKVEIPIPFKVVPRRVWGGRRLGGAMRLPVRLEFAHTPVIDALPKNATRKQKIARMERIDEIGRARFGPNSGFSYSFYIFQDGEVWAGRGRGRSGAHTVGDIPPHDRNFNFDSYGIAVDGNGDVQAWSKEAKVAFVDLTNWLQGKGDVVAEQSTWPHRKVTRKRCPGNMVSDDEIRRIQTQGRR